mmetsp:Transcript_26647/g.74560  ORF Transcript_26647/g.74560 Transcript_26647/m.74560 type:complete len:277 (+) Transcript_26647:289-1119(+)
MRQQDGGRGHRRPEARGDAGDFRCCRVHAGLHQGLLGRVLRTGQPQIQGGQGRRPGHRVRDLRQRHAVRNEGAVAGDLRRPAGREEVAHPRTGAPVRGAIQREGPQAAGRRPAAHRSGGHRLHVGHQEAGQDCRQHRHEERPGSGGKQGHRAHEQEDHDRHHQAQGGAGNHARDGRSHLRPVRRVPRPGHGRAALAARTPREGHCHQAPIRRHHQQHEQAGGQPVGCRPVPSAPAAGPGDQRELHLRPGGPRGHRTCRRTVEPPQGTRRQASQRAW